MCKFPGKIWYQQTLSNKIKLKPGFASSGTQSMVSMNPQIRFGVPSFDDVENPDLSMPADDPTMS